MNDTSLTRRRFLTRASASLAVAALHGGFSGAAPARRRAPETGARLLDVDLETAVPLGDMKAYYGGLLGFPILEETASRLVVGAGASRLSFRPAAKAGSRPFYHFAFNIPENKIRLAADWQRSKGPLIPIPERNRDPEMPDAPDVVDYSHWNAHSVFFFDPAENVVEYIARHDLKNGAPGPFSTADVLCASEIAFVVDDVPAAAAEARRAFALENYRGASDGFAALGDENGLLLVMKRGRHISFGSPKEKRVDVFPTRARVRAGEKCPGGYAPPAGFPYEIAAG